MTIETTMNEMIEEASKTADLADLRGATVRREVAGSELKLVLIPINTNSKHQMQKRWFFAGKKVPAAKLKAAIEAANQDKGPLPATLVQADASFAATYSSHRQMNLSKVAALRAAASNWGWTRKEFIAAAEKYGINKATAATQWQQGRK